MKKKWYYMIAMVFLISCQGEQIDPMLSNIFGWLQPNENLNQIENDFILANAANNPPAVDLTPRFPPVKSQGNYGTCVAWACGYYFRSYLQAVEKKLTTSELASENNQFSPKDLFLAIPSSAKGRNCNGTYFEAAFDIMLNRGIARMSTAPYTSLGDCSGSPSPAWNSEAANYKIVNYREITPITKDKIKTYIAQRRPVVFGAKLGENFMRWNSGDVITSDTEDYKGQHAYHAMVVVGYSDNKGPNGAFKVINSWGTEWGDAGFIWVDYNYFINQFCYAAFVGQEQQADPDNNNDGIVDDDKVVNGENDLIAYELTDVQGNPANKRDITYDIYNQGSATIPASAKWSAVYLYYNAYNANEYNILLYDYYTNEIGSPGQNGQLTTGMGPTLYGSSGNWWNNVDIGSRMRVAEAVYGTGTGGFRWGYTIPAGLHGNYYFVLIVDPFDAIKEYDEDNNYYFFTSPNGGPVQVINGQIYTNFNGRIAKNQRSATVYDKNAYTPAEIKSFLKHEMKNGRLARKINAFVQSQGKTKMQ